MITGYLPILKAPSDTSSSWYKEFHNIFYLSQLTNVLLLSYVDSFIEIVSESTILEVKEDYLVKNKIISISEESGERIVTKYKEDEIKSIDIEDYLSEIIEEGFKKKIERTEILFSAMGLEVESSPDIKIDIDIKELLKSTNAKNWYEILKGFLNIWEFTFVYSIFETTLKKILNVSGQIREENLINEIIDKYPTLISKLEDELSINEEAINYLWQLYTEFRNIYSHSHGIMTQRTKSNIGGKLKNFKDSFKIDDMIKSALVDTDKIFPNNSIIKDKFYLIKDDELNIFRNFIISFMENLDEVDN